MSPSPTLPRATEHELNRLHRLAHAAHLRGDFAQEATCNIRWVELYRQTGASDSPAPAVILTQLQAKNASTAEHVPLWRVRQRLAPLCAIVLVEEKRFSNAAGHKDNYFIEHLSCGHQNIWTEGLEYPYRTKRRRCKECGDAAIIAGGYTGELGAAKPAPEPDSTVALSRALPQLNSSTVTFTSTPDKATLPQPSKTPEVYVRARKPRRDYAPAAKPSTLRGRESRE